MVVLPPPALVGNVRPSRLRAFLAYLWPATGATQEIAALDGLRALAIIQIVAYHLIIGVYQGEHTHDTMETMLGHNNPAWIFVTPGVHLFFILSGFLLFRPYARTLLGLHKPPRPAHSTPAGHCGCSPHTGHRW